jgi:hypothetical protein
VHYRTVAGPSAGYALVPPKCQYFVMALVVTKYSMDELFDLPGRPGQRLDARRTASCSVSSRPLGCGPARPEHRSRTILVGKAGYLHARLAKAQDRGWLGEVDGIEASLDAECDRWMTMTLRVPAMSC